MRVLVIASDIVPNRLGGAEGHLVEVLKRLAPKLERVVVVVGSDDSIKELFKKLPQISFAKVYYPRVPNLYGVAYILFATPVACFWAIRGRCNLVWASQEFPQAQVGAIVKIFTGIPLYVTSQNPLLHLEELVVKGRLLRRASGFFAGWLGPVIKFGIKTADCLGAVSGYSARKAREMGARKVVVIPNGVDLLKFKVQNSKLKVKTTKPEMLRIVTISSLIPRNGIETLIEASSRLPKQINWELIIVGDGPMRTELESLVETRKIMRKVKFFGRVSNDRVPEFLTMSFVFVRPSRHEGFGSAFIEAMAVGIPVIGTPVGGITDFLNDGQTGLLVPPNDPAALTSKLVRLWKDKKLYAKLARNGSELVRRKYGWDDIAGRVWQEFCGLTR